MDVRGGGIGTWLTIDRFPVLVWGALILLAWWAADLHYHAEVMAVPTPFTQLWASYDATRAGELVFVVMVGLAAAMVVPLGSGMTIAALTRRTRGLMSSARNWWLLLAVVLLLLLVVAKQPYVLSAPTYLASDAPRWLGAVASAAGPLLPLVAGVVAVRRPLTGTIIVVVTWLLLFANATRIMAGVPVLFLIGLTVGGVLVRWWAWLAAVAAAALTLPIPLINRGQGAHGLLNYLAPTWQAVTGPNYLHNVGSVIGDNVGVIIPLLTHVADRPSIPESHMWVSVDPRPSGAAGWVDIADHMRVHRYIPYSALGEFANLGAVALAAFVVGVSLLLRAAILSATSSLSRAAVFVLAAQVGLAMLVVVQASEYNTRAVARLLSFMLVLAVAERLWRVLSARFCVGRGRSVAGSPGELLSQGPSRS